MRVFALSAVFPPEPIILLTSGRVPFIPSFKLFTVRRVDCSMEILGEVIGKDTDSLEFQEMYAGIWADCRPDYFAILRKEVPELLKEIHRRGYLVALASSTSRAGIEEVLTTCGLKGDFDYIISGEEFKESKPNPEIYLHTAEALHCAPEECLVVEDSTYGIMQLSKPPKHLISGFIFLNRSISRRFKLVCFTEPMTPDFKSA